MSRFAVVGEPIAHSRSPRMHTAAYRALGLPHSYAARPASAAELPGVIADLRSGRLEGCNVTVPHKQRVLELVDRVAPSALSCGAANTLLRSSDGAIVAHNTDVPALADELRDLGACGAALVLGNGGAARAALAALARVGVGRIVVRARAFADASVRESQLSALRSAVPPGIDLRGEPFESGSGAELETGVVVQATSLGLLAPGELAARAVDWRSLPPSACAIDLVYGPQISAFVQAARESGCRATDGLGMLARQGALSFEAWLGVPAPLYTMWAAIL